MAVTGKPMAVSRKGHFILEKGNSLSGHSHAASDSCSHNFPMVQEERCRKHIWRHVQGILSASEDTSLVSSSCTTNGSRLSTGVSLFTYARHESLEGARVRCSQAQRHFSSNQLRRRGKWPWRQSHRGQDPPSSHPKLSAGPVSSAPINNTSNSCGRLFAACHPPRLRTQRIPSTRSSSRSPRRNRKALPRSRSGRPTNPERSI